MRIKEHMALFTVVMTIVIALWNNAEASQFNSTEENVLWNTIKHHEKDMAETLHKAAGLEEKVKLVKNHYSYKEKLTGRLNEQLNDIHLNGSIQVGKAHTGAVENMKIGEMDLEKITRAVAVAETNNGKTGSGPTHNNPCGLMFAYYENNVRIREYVYYNSYMEGFNACSKLLANGPSWAKTKYRDQTIAEAADLWTGKDRVDNWINNATKTYKRQL